MSKKRERSFETVFIQSDSPLNLRLIADLIVKKINRGELNFNDKSKVQRSINDVGSYNDDEKH